MSGTVWVPRRAGEGGASALPATSWSCELPHSVVAGPRDLAVAVQLAPAAPRPTARDARFLVRRGIKLDKYLRVTVTTKYQHLSSCMACLSL